MMARAAANKGSQPLSKATLGQHIRMLRKDRQLTLRELSVRSEVPIPTISKIELGQITASYEKLLAIAGALGVEIGTLFSPQQRSSAAGQGRSLPTVVKTRPAKRLRYNGPSYTYQMLASEFPGKTMTPLVATIEARATGAERAFVHHPGHEFVLVLAGAIAIRFETGETTNLKTHESAYFASDVGHLYISTSVEDADVVIVMTEAQK